MMEVSSSQLLAEAASGRLLNLAKHRSIKPQKLSYFWFEDKNSNHKPLGHCYYRLL